VERESGSRLHVDVAWLRGRSQSKLRNAKTCHVPDRCASVAVTRYIQSDYSFVNETMGPMSKEKHYDTIAPQNDERRQPVKSDGRVVRSVAAVIILCLGFLRLSGVLNEEPHVALTIRERANVILKENPLIG
jgi:hypothetical protein